jgi:hypothetical protein
MVSFVESWIEKIKVRVAQCAMMMVINKLTLLTGREHRGKEKIRPPKGWKAEILSNTAYVSRY